MNTYLNISSRYQFIKPLGKGSFGEVFLVYDTKLGVNWAAKKVDSITKNEVTALKSISHPAFPRIVDTEPTTDGFLIIMDYIEGESLTKYVSEHHLTKSTYKSIALKLAEALLYLHNMSPSMLYLDCKPDNIIVSSDGSIKLIDLGSAYMYTSKQKGRISGSAGFAPPEQRKGASVDIRSDVYAYGKTLKAMAHGTKPPRLIQTIIDKATKANPKKRYQSMTEIINILNSPSHLSVTEFFYRLGRFNNLFCGILITLFTILGYYTYAETMDPLYLVLGSMLFILLIVFLSSCELPSWRRTWVCHQDITMTQGMRILPVILAALLPPLLALSLPISSIAAPYTQLTATQLTATQLSGEPTSVTDYHITIYDSEGYKIIYKGQTTTCDASGNLSINIPLSSITPDAKPSRIECTID